MGDVRFVAGDVLLKDEGAGAVVTFDADCCCDTDCRTICDIDTSSDVTLTAYGLGDCNNCFLPNCTYFNGRDFVLSWDAGDSRWELETSPNLKIRAECITNNAQAWIGQVGRWSDQWGVFDGEDPSDCFAQSIDNDLVVGGCIGNQCCYDGLAYLDGA